MHTYLQKKYAVMLVGYIFVPAPTFTKALFVSAMDLKDTVHAILLCKLLDIKKLQPPKYEGRQMLLIELAVSIRHVLVSGSIAHKMKD